MYERFLQLLSEYETTAYKVGKVTGISASTFSDWKTGRSTPKQDKLSKIADYFNVSLDWLVGASDNKEVNNMPPEKPIPHKIKILARNLDELPDEDREKLVQNFQDTIDIYLKARGIQKKDDGRKE